VGREGYGDRLPTGSDQLARKIWARLYRYIYYKVQNHEEAEELTQETFERVQPRIAAGKVDEEKIEAYYFAAAKNLIAEEWRKRVRQQGTISMEELAGRGWEPALPEPDREAEDALLLKEALQRLENDHRRVLTLRIIEGWPVNVTAKKMRRTPGAIRSLQFRAVLALRELLQEGGYFDEGI